MSVNIRPRIRMEPQVRFDLLQELITGVNAHKTQYSSTIVGVTLSENSVVVGMTEIKGNIAVASQFSITL